MIKNCVRCGREFDTKESNYERICSECAPKKEVHRSTITRRRASELVKEEGLEVGSENWRYCQLYRARGVYGAYVHRCKKEGIPTDKFYTPERIVELFEKTPICLCCGNDINYIMRIGCGGLTLDKVIPDKGYVRGNVQVICGRCNQLKSNHTLETLKKLEDYIKRAVEVGDSKLDEEEWIIPIPTELDTRKNRVNDRWYGERK
jgi:5-methylcytosine-specific restriction endonuclease McrA